MPVSGFSDYAVSSNGRVKRVIPDYRGRVDNIIKPYTATRYATVTLYRNRTPYVVCVHRIVCAAFNGNPPSIKHQAAHNDGDRTNNKSSNLRWATPSENESDKVAHGTSRLGKPTPTKLDRLAKGATHGRNTMPERTARGEKTGTSKLTEEKVKKIRKDRRSRKEIARDYGITVTMVGYIVRGVSWAHIPMPMERNYE